MIDYLLEQSGNSINHEEISSRLLRSLKKKSESVIESIKGYQMTDSQKYPIRLIYTHGLYHVYNLRYRLIIIDSLVKPYDNAVKLLCIIPRVNRRSAITIISEIGTNMTQFSNSKCLCCWTGLTPDNNESASKKKSVRITRAGVHLKPALVQVAHAAMKSNKSPYYKAKYERTMKHRDKKRAIIAIARMILTATYQCCLQAKYGILPISTRLIYLNPSKKKQK